MIQGVFHHVKYTTGTHKPLKSKRLYKVPY